MFAENGTFRGGTSLQSFAFQYKDSLRSAALPSHNDLTVSPARNQVLIQEQTPLCGSSSRHHYVPAHHSLHEITHFMQLLSKIQPSWLCCSSALSSAYIYTVCSACSYLKLNPVKSSSRPSFFLLVILSMLACSIYPPPVTVEVMLERVFERTDQDRSELVSLLRQSSSWIQALFKM